MWGRLSACGGLVNPPSQSGQRALSCAVANRAQDFILDFILPHITRGCAAIELKRILIALPRN
jgi:hypothetical protein